MISLHFIRPWWFLALIPLGVLLYRLLRKVPISQIWMSVCDKHLLNHLLQGKSQHWRQQALILLFLSGFFMVVSLAGPSFSKLPVASYSKAMPRVVVLDMSDAMLERDLTPSRLARAKFKLHDLFTQKDKGQFGLVVYTDEPFVVSPLTEDGLTIDALMPSLSPEMMPVDGQRLDLALDEAQKMIRQAGFKKGQILVMTPEQPTLVAIDKAEHLAKEGIVTSIMPLRRGEVPDPQFQRFAKAGGGQLLLFSDTPSDLEKWLSYSPSFDGAMLKSSRQVAVFRDDGRWFLLLAIVLLLPVFRRGYLQRLWS